MTAITGLPQSSRPAQTTTRALSSSQSISWSPTRSTGTPSCLALKLGSRTAWSRWGLRIYGFMDLWIYGFKDLWIQQQNLISCPGPLQGRLWRTPHVQGQKHISLDSDWSVQNWSLVCICHWSGTVQGGGYDCKFHNISNYENSNNQLWNKVTSFWEPTFLIRGTGFYKKRVIASGFVFSYIVLKFKNLRCGTNKKCLLSLQMFSGF